MRLFHRLNFAVKKQVDSMKGDTLQEISSLVNSITMELKSRKEG